MIAETEIILRLVLAAVLGMIVGYERERQNQPAGLRTHTILAIGSCLAMTISINIAMQFYPQVPNGDPGRIAAQVVSGIGFLGAGAILRYGTNVKGLTTATSLWTTAIVGLAVGAGHYFAASAAIVALLLVLVVLNMLEKKVIRSFVTIPVMVTAENQPELVTQLHQAMKALKKKVISTTVEVNIPENTSTVTMILKTIEEESQDDIYDALAKIPGIIRYRVNG